MCYLCYCRPKKKKKRSDTTTPRIEYNTPNFRWTQTTLLIHTIQFIDFTFFSNLFQSIDYEINRSFVLTVVALNEVPLDKGIRLPRQSSPPSLFVSRMSTRARISSRTLKCSVCRRACQPSLRSRSSPLRIQTASRSRASGE